MKKREPSCDPQRPRERRATKRHRDSGNSSARELFPEEAVNRRAGKRQQRDDPEIQIAIRSHSLSRFTWSMLRVSRVRYTAMMIAKPTAASAAATTITKNTKTWQLRACHFAAKATNERFTPLSISSMDMKMVMILRLIKNPVTPHANRIALRTR